MLKNMLQLIDSHYKKDEDFEVDFGIAKSTVSAWRRGKLKSYGKYASKFAAFFGVSLDWLSGNEQKNKPAAKSDELDEALKPLRDIMSDFTEEERVALVEYAEFLRSKHKKSNQE